MCIKSFVISVMVDTFALTKYIDMSASGVLKRSVFKKVLAAFTGLFLCLFLVGHLAGNLQLLFPLMGHSTAEAQTAFNEYALFMTTNPAVKIMSYITYFSILFHAVMGIYLARKNRQARPVGYGKNNVSANSMWSSRNMGLLGIVIMAFIVLHMSDFWFKMHFGPIGEDPNGLTDLYSLVITKFGQLWYVALYVVCMIAVALHLVHGFQSGFQSLGLNHPTYTPIIKKTGLAFAIIIPLLFAIIPVAIFLTA